MWLMTLMTKKFLELSSKKNCEKQIKKSRKIEKIIKRKGDKN